MTIQATGHRSEFGYDGLGRRVCIRELDPDTSQNLQVTSNKKYLWDGVEIAEERDATGGIVQKRFYSQGSVETDGTILFCTRDHLGSIRELTDGTQTVRARYDFDPYGRVTKVQGDRDSSFTYTGHFWHPQSGLYLTLFRAYDPSLGVWISKDPIEESGGINLYGYVGNNPVNYYDETGLASSDECKELRRKIITKWIKMVYKVAKYDPWEDAIGGHSYFGGSKRTKPHSHYKEIVRWQKELQEQITEYKKKCSDRCDPPGPPARPLPKQVPDDAFNPNLIPPIPDWMLNDGDWQADPMQFVPFPLPAPTGIPLLNWMFAL